MSNIKETYIDAKAIMMHSSKPTEYKDLMLGINGVLKDCLSSEGVPEEYAKNWRTVYLHILSSEEIKEGDCFIGETNLIKKCVKIGKNGAQLHTEDGYAYFKHKSRKVVSSTDKSLGLPRPDKEFIRTYLVYYNNDEYNTIEDVIVEVDSYEQLSEISENIFKKEKTITKLKLKNKEAHVKIKEDDVDIAFTEYLKEHPAFDNDKIPFINWLKLYYNITLKRK